MERLSIVVRRLRHQGGSRNEGFLQLFISKRLLHGLATAMLGLFVPIFLYDISGQQLWFVTSFYAVVGVLYVACLVPAMKLTNKVGFTRMLGVAMVFSVAFNLLLLFMDSSNYLYLIAPAVITLLCFRLFHWVSYHVNFALLTSSGERGKSVSLMFAALALMSMIGPILGGLIINAYGYEAMFGLAIVLLSLAGLSYLFVPTVEEEFTWSFTETVRQFISPSFRRTAYLEAAYGAEAIMNLVAWPLFIYVVLEGNLLEVGGVTALIVLVSIVVQLIVGKYLDNDKNNAITALKRGSVFHAFGWLLKMFVFTSLHVFVVGLYHNITRIFVRTPYNTMLYDASGDQGHYVDEFTVLREAAHHSGRVLALLAITLLAFYVPLEITFIIGVVASLLLNSLAAKQYN